MKNIVKKIIAIALTAAIFSYLIYIYFVPPEGGSVHLVCPTKQIFNLNCVGCGLTRFVYFAVHGDFNQALKYNVFGPLIILVLLIIYFYFIRWSFFNKPFPEVKPWLVWAFLAFVVIYSVLRNLPFQKLRFLAPPDCIFSYYIAN